MMRAFPFSFVSSICAVFITFLLPMGLASAQLSDTGKIEQGRKIAIAADCAACHTAPDAQGKPYAGNYAIVSPLGVIVSSNITASKQYGIGSYTLEQFKTVMRQGIRPDGTHLYPAMPYDTYQQMTDTDIAALYSYLTLATEPVDAAPTLQTRLGFPFNQRYVMSVWNVIFARHKVFSPDPKLTDQQNRGAYLVDVLGHCGTCHTQRNLLMGSDRADYLGGGQVGSWYAPNITPDVASGIGAWSETDIVTYLKTGKLAGKAQAAGPMAEAVEDSFRYLPDSDLQSIAAYLKVVPPINHANAKKVEPATDNVDLEATIRGTEPQTANNTLQSGMALYSGYCASCHQPDGKGSDNQAYPSLIGNSATSRGNPNNLVAAMLFGVRRQSDLGTVIMPTFGKGSQIAELSDDDVEKIANYVLTSFGNANLHVSVADVAAIRAGGPQPLLALVQPFIAPAICVVLLVLLCLASMIYGRRKLKAHNARF